MSSTNKFKGKKAAPRFEAEGTILWEKPEGYNQYGYKDVLVKIDAPQFLDKKFGPEDAKLIKEAFKPGQETPEETVAFMSVHEKYTKGAELEPLGKKVYLEYTIKVNPSKKDPSKKYVNMYLKKLEVLQESEEAA